MYNLTLAASPHCQQGKLGTTLETAEPLLNRQHAILTPCTVADQCRILAYATVIHSRFLFSCQILERFILTPSRGETPVEIPRHGPSFQILGLLCPSLSDYQGQIGTLDKAHDIIFPAKFCSDRYIVSHKQALTTQS